MKALIIVDHGSKVDEANEVLYKIAEILRKDENSGFDIIEPCHMEIARPSIYEAYKKCVDSGAEKIVVHPYFLVPGRHSKYDIPRMVGEAARDFPGVEFHVSEPLGVHRKIIDVVLEKSHSCL